MNNVLDLVNIVSEGCRVLCNGASGQLLESAYCPSASSGTTWCGLVGRPGSRTNIVRAQVTPRRCVVARPMMLLCPTAFCFAKVMEGMDALILCILRSCVRKYKACDYENHTDDDDFGPVKHTCKVV